MFKMGNYESNQGISPTINIRQITILSLMNVRTNFGRNGQIKSGIRQGFWFIDINNNLMIFFQKLDRIRPHEQIL